MQRRKENFENFNKMINNPINYNTSSMMNKQTSNISRTNEFKIEKIDINTQATNTEQISREISNSLQQELKKTTSTYEDSILA